ncbi:hypothetical protein KEM54_004740 [Ascosphaera aggregata]|nr:hypothetical protein KEM54_004740 [Ascosphaera aggregata]
MLTPTEKYIFNTLMLTLFTLGLTATYIYLPNSLITFWQKILYYCMGEVSAASSSAAATASNMASSIANSTKEGVISLSGNMTEGLGNFFMQKGASSGANGAGDVVGVGVGAAAAAASAASAGQKVL